MKKNNPFYHYLTKYQKALIQSKTNVHGEDYLLLPLEAVSKAIKFHYQGAPLRFIEHHLTVFKETNDEVGFNSHSHYTICFQSHTIHVYFQENGAFITATIQNNELQEITVLNDFFDKDFFNIHLVLEENIKPFLLDLIDQHAKVSHDLKSTYLTDITELKQSLFDSSEDISKNLNTVQRLIKKAESLKSMIFTQSFLSQTLSYLNSCKITLEGIIQLRKVTKVKATAASIKSIEAVAETPTLTKVQLRSVDKSGHKLKAQTAQLFSQNSRDFEIAYQRYEAAWSSLESSQEVLSCQLKLFSEIVSRELLIDLNQKALILSLQIDPGEPSLQLLSRQANLDISLFQEKFNQYGVSLLLDCLKSKELLVKHTHVLKNFVEHLNHSHLEEVIRLKNIPAIEFLLKNGEFNLNNLRIKRRKSKLSPLCDAYRLNNLELFEILLKYKASPMFLYEDMPLAHVLLQLQASDPFYKIFMVHYTKAMDGNPRLYHFLCKAIECKLEKSQLSEEETQPLKEAKVKYERFIASYTEGIKLSSACKGDIFSISSHLNPRMLDNLRSSPRVASLFEEFSHKSQMLNELMRKQRISTKSKMFFEGLMKDASKMIEHGLGGCLNQLTEDDICASLRENIIDIDAYIDYLTLKTKTHLSSSEEQRLQNAIKVLAAAQESYAKSKTHRDVPDISAPLNDLTQSLERLQSLLRDFFNLEGDNEAFDELNFMAAAEGTRMGSSSSRTGCRQPRVIDAESDDEFADVDFMAAAGIEENYEFAEVVVGSKMNAPSLSSIRAAAGGGSLFSQPKESLTCETKHTPSP